MQNRDAYHVRSGHEWDVAGTEPGRKLPLFRSGLNPLSDEDDEEKYVFYNVSADSGIEVFVDDNGPRLDDDTFEVGVARTVGSPRHSIIAYCMLIISICCCTDA